MSDPMLTNEERWLQAALRTEAETLPLRIEPGDLRRRWSERRRTRIVRRLGLAATIAAVAVVGLAATWHPWQQNQPTLVAFAGGINGQPQLPAGPGLSAGRATISLAQPQSATSSFVIGCGWSVHGHLVGLTIGKQAIGNEYLFVRWKLALGPQYQIELVNPDNQTSFIGSAGNYASQAAADGSSGSIVFTDLVLNSGDPSTAPRRSGTFTWTCEHPATLGRPAPSLPSPTVDEQGVPALWILQNGTPARRALTGCPITLDTPSRGFATSCATSNWWEPLQSLNSSLEVGPGDTLAFALDGWTVTSADVVAALSSSAAGSVDNPLVDLKPLLGNGAVAFSPPGPGSWYVHFTIEAAMDDGSTLDAEYSYPITVH
jgi:hypothetical protein